MSFYSRCRPVPCSIALSCILWGTVPMASLAGAVCVEAGVPLGCLPAEPLLQYKISPFTVFYIGSTHDVNRFEQPVGRMQSQRQFFFKVQYLFRV